jgi:N-acyl homoserine lactone hydrolase
MSSQVLRLFVGTIAGPLGPKTPLYSYAVKQPDGVVLIDTGMNDPGDAEWAKTWPLEIRPITDALADHRLTPEDVNTVVITHLDHDHSGNNTLFAHATIVVQESEIEHQRATLTPEMREHWDYEGAKFRPINGDVQLTPNLRILATPGHTPGHQSILVGQGRDAELIVGDAAYDYNIWKLGEDFDESHPAWAIQIRTDKDTWLSSIERLRDFKADTIFFGHDNHVLTGG